MVTDLYELVQRQVEYFRGIKYINSYVIDSHTFNLIVSSIVEETGMSYDKIVSDVLRILTEMGYYVAY
ncbi:virion structural protein [Betalipothrixvirus uzonense]|uniref:Viral structural protein n=1 Tax=Betalipothrixvirus uzonense TaxID=512792 RepID=B2CRP8_9VIRU|nr:virion structural protein [Acidianus filamentous virus 9]ACB37305.1 viral structural protein [Acidianus filamentous virus 9]